MTPAGNARDSISFEQGTLYLLDQTLLPLREEYLELHDPAGVVDAIRRLAVRGAMAIGVAAAYGVVLGATGGKSAGEAPGEAGARAALEMIAASRPTARNLFWALEQMQAVIEECAGAAMPELGEKLLSRADEIANETIESNRRLVSAGQEVVPRGAGALTHCNSGPLAALRYGTALGVLIEAHRLGREVHVYVDETRPLLQGARITAWELEREGVPYTLLPDSAAAVLMETGRVGMVITGADRIAANGDTANKIGTYALAVLSSAHNIPFYIAAPFSTVDAISATGAGIVIEQRDPDEVRTCGRRRVAPAGAPVFNPAFDVTPARLISAIITDRGVFGPPYSFA